jgi:RecJ-like exonuclease
MVVEVPAFRTDDGKLFLTHLEATMHENPKWHTCPHCKGKGHTLEEYNAYPQGFPDSGWVEDMKERAVICTVCKGKCATPTLLKPVTKVVGYE